MIVDTSALIAILLSEPERPVLEDKLAQDPYPRMSATTLLEAGIVVDSRRDPVATRLLDDLIAGSGLTIESVTYEQALIARQAYRDFGRGSGHPAQLNFGDCFSYALARSQDEALLFKGDGFNHTDIRPA